MGTWNKELPGETNSFAEMPVICQDNFGAVESIFGQEHQTFNETACGTHIPGVAGVVKSGSSTTIAALTSPGSGAIAWDTTLGYWRRYWQSAWGYPGSAIKWSRIRAYKSTNQDLTSVNGGSQTATITFDTENYDTLSEFAANTFTPADSGYYLIISALALCGGSTETTATCSTYPASAVSEIWSASKTSLPTADVGTTQWGVYPASLSSTHCSAIGKVAYDESSCISATASELDYFQHKKFSLAAGSTIHAVRIYSKGKRLAGTLGYLATLLHYIRVGTTWYNHSTWKTIPNTDSGYMVSTWTLNPATGGAWTVDQINETAASYNLSGIGLKNNATGGSNSYIYQTFIQVDYTSTGNNFARIDEPTVDDEDQLVCAPTISGTSNAEVFAVGSDGANIPYSSPSQLSATVNVRARVMTATGTKLKGALRVGTTNYYSAESAIATGDFANYTFVWSQNPATSAAWTSGQFAGVAANSISGYGFYISTGTSMGTANVSQCYLKTDWDAEHSASILLRKGGTVVSSATRAVRAPGVEVDDQVNIVDMMYLTAGQTVDVQVTKTGLDDVVMSGSDATYVSIHRLGSQGM